jgi:hypothetical protein
MTDAGPISRNSNQKIKIEKKMIQSSQLFENKNKTTN